MAVAPEAVIVFSAGGEAWCAAVERTIGDRVRGLTTEPSSELAPWRLVQEALAKFEFAQCVVAIVTPSNDGPLPLPPLIPVQIEVPPDANPNRFFVIWGESGGLPSWLARFQCLDVFGQTPDT